MKKMIFALLAVLAACTLCVAQNDSHIIGHVIDKKTQEHIPYIYVRLVGTNIITSTDASGHYKLTNIPSGTFEIEASGIGYISEVKRIFAEPKYSTMEELTQIRKNTGKIRAHNRR